MIQTTFESKAFIGLHEFCFGASLDCNNIIECHLIDLKVFSLEAPQILQTHGNQLTTLAKCPSGVLYLNKAVF